VTGHRENGADGSRADKGQRTALLSQRKTLRTLHFVVKKEFVYYILTPAHGRVGYR